MKYTAVTASTAQITTELVTVGLGSFEERDRYRKIGYLKGGPESSARVPMVGDVIINRNEICLLKLGPSSSPPVSTSPFR